MREIIIIVLLVIIGWGFVSSDIIYTNHNSDEHYYKVDKIEPYHEGKVIYNINSRDRMGAKESLEGRYDNLQIIDTVGAFDIGDEIILVPTKR